MIVPIGHTQQCCFCSFCWWLHHFAAAGLRNRPSFSSSWLLYDRACWVSSIPGWETKFITQPARPGSASLTTSVESPVVSFSAEPLVCLSLGQVFWQWAVSHRPCHVMTDVILCVEFAVILVPLLCLSAFPFHTALVLLKLRRLPEPEQTQDRGRIFYTVLPLCVSLSTDLPILQNLTKISWGLNEISTICFGPNNTGIAVDKAPFKNTSFQLFS